MKFDSSHIRLSKNDINRGLLLPESPSAELAEFIGILTGDGYINFYPNQYKYLLEIAGDSRLDIHYLQYYVSNLIISLFNIEPSIYQRNDQNSLYLRLISKGLTLFLMNIEFKCGRKEQIGVPLWIKGNDLYFRHFLKGLADTDFSITFRDNYPIISFASKSKILVTDVEKYLKTNDFKLGKPYKYCKIDPRGYNNSTTYQIKLNGRYNFALWSQLINFRNPRHLKKN